MTIIRAGELEPQTKAGSTYSAAYKEAVAVVEAYEAAGVVLNTH